MGHGKTVMHIYLKSLEYAALYTKVFTDLVIKTEAVNDTECVI